MDHLQPHVRRQIRWLERHFELISLEETQRRIRSGANRRPAVSITFDDGYAENCRQAIPLLIKEQIPCTYFVTVRNVLEGVPFEHDLACGHRFPPNTPEQLRAMAAAGIEIGAHSYTHPDLGAHHAIPGSFIGEVVEARDELQAALGCPIRYFAFPYGQHANLSRQAFELGRGGGLRGGLLGLRRIQLARRRRLPPAADRRGRPMIRLKNWVTGDPRKRKMPRPAWEPSAGWNQHVPTCSEQWDRPHCANPSTRSGRAFGKWSDVRMPFAH